MMHIKRLGIVFLMLLLPFYARSAEVSKSKTVQEMMEQLSAAADQGKTLDGKTSPSLIFKLSTKKQLEKMGLKKSGGGGVVDGGGGNLFNGTLFDIHQSQGLKELSSETMLALLNRHWGEAIKRWDSETPGIAEWLQEPLSLPWYLDSKSISPKKCLYLSTRQMPICYNFTSVLIQEKSFDSLSEAEQARHILTALFTYHYAQNSYPVTQTDLLKVGQGVAKLLDQSSASSISTGQLQHLKVLSSDEELEQFRELALSIIAPLIREQVGVMRKVGWGCTLESGKSIFQSPAAMEKLLLKFVEDCESIANENEVTRLCLRSEAIEASRIAKSCAQASENQSHKRETDVKAKRYLESLLSLRKQPPATETEIAFLWGAKVYRLNKCINGSGLSGFPSLKECLDQDTSIKSSATKNVGTPLDAGLLKSLVKLPLADRLDRIESATPGFEKWLFSGFNVPWNLTSIKLNSSFCLNQSAYEVKAKPVACFNRRGVEISEDWYNSSVVSDRHRAEVILHELIRIRVTELSDFVSMSQLEQDNIVASLSAAVLDYNVPTRRVYEMLQGSSLVQSGGALDRLRMNQSVVVASEHLMLIKKIDVLLNSCRAARSPEPRLKELFKKQFEYIRECRRFYKESDPVNHCIPDLMSNRLVDYGIYCGPFSDVLPE